MTIFGTRPEIIRLAPTMHKLDKYFEHIKVNTNQNRDFNMNEIFLNEFNIFPKYNLKINTDKLNHELADIFENVGEIIDRENPDKILVLGDTYSALAAVYANFKDIPVYHMEAGNRSFDQRMPEEKNRKLIDHSSYINLPYTENSRRNLLREGFDSSKIFVTGNPIRESLENFIEYNKESLHKNESLLKHNLSPHQYILVTLHRKENTSNPVILTNIIRGIEKIAETKTILLITHPRTMTHLKQFDLKLTKNIKLTTSVGYKDMITLMQNSYMVMSDSGTVPEECVYWGIKSITLRDSTERPELLDMGATILSGTKPDEIYNAYQIIKNSTTVNWKENILGGTNISDKVINIMASKL